MDERSRRAALIALIGGALVAIGAFLPWAKVTSPFDSATKNGIEGDGAITLVVAILVLIACGAALAKVMPARAVRWASITAISGGAIALAIALIDGLDIRSQTGSIGTTLIEATVGIGVYLTGIGGLAAVAGGVMLLSATSATKTAPAPSAPPEQTL